MKATMLGLVAATVVCAGSSLYLWHELGEARDRAAQLEDASAKLNARLAELEKARATFAQRRMDVFGGNPMMSPGPAPLEGHGPPPPGTAPGNGPEHFEATVLNAPRPDHLPGFQKMIRAQIKGNNKRMYADVGDALGLSKAEADKLVDLITEQQLRGMTARRDAVEGGDQKSFDDMTRAMEDMRRQQEAEVTDLIGADKAESLKKYQESMPARSEVEMIARQLEGTDAPLTDDQRKKMVTVMTEERARVPMPEFAVGVDPEQYQKDVAAWQTDYNERVASQARGILNTDQLNAYNDYQQWQTEMRQQFASGNFGAARATARGPGAAPNVMFSAGAVAVPIPPPSATKKN